MTKMTFPKKGMGPLLVFVSGIARNLSQFMTIARLEE
jgi:hypothetical protein